MAKFDDINIGDRKEIKHLITREDVEKFVQLTGDDNKLHIDEAYASTTSFKRPVVHGMLSASFISTIIGTKIPGDGALWYKQSLEFFLPVREGDEIKIVAEVIGKMKHLNSIELSTDIYNQNRQKVIGGTAQVKIIEELDKIEQDVEIKPANTALVLGATGGIGKATAVKLASNGYDLILQYNNNENKAIELKRELEEYGVKVYTFKVDLLKDTDYNEVFEFVQRKFNRLSVFINAATVPLCNIKFDQLEWSDFEKQINSNIKSNFLLIQKIYPLMSVQSYGKIVLISTQAIEQPNTEWMHYISAKSALHGFMKATALEVSKHGIRINMVSPGMTDTELVANIPNKIRLLNAAKTPLRRIATPEDIANAIYFLASEESDFLTGETIRVNGGQVMI